MSTINKMNGYLSFERSPLIPQYFYTPQRMVPQFLK
jgi:hypothetical protein